MNQIRGENRLYYIRASDERLSLGRLLAVISEKAL